MGPPLGAMLLWSAASLQPQHLTQTARRASGKPGRSLIHGDHEEVRQAGGLPIVKDQPEHQGRPISEADAESPHPKPQGEVRALPTHQLPNLMKDFPRNLPGRSRLNLSPQDSAETASVPSPEKEALRHLPPRLFNRLRDAPDTLKRQTLSLFRKVHAYHLSSLFSLFSTPSPSMRSRHLMTGWSPEPGAIPPKSVGLGGVPAVKGAEHPSGAGLSHVQTPSSWPPENVRDGMARPSGANALDGTPP
uniref:Uncharacterized protein n=1 Tax=Thermus scotoductus TaxID=37636 RepID=A0A346FPX7_THESC|nr:hypothetical protein [Thermus scotoductus]